MADFESPDAKAQTCDLSFQIPRLPAFPSFNLPAIPAIPTLPKLPLPLGLSCDPKEPANVVGDQPYGGGRVAKRDPDPDLEGR